MIKIGEALFLKRKFKPAKPKRKRTVSAKPKVNNAIAQIDEREYLSAVYPNMDYELYDSHCNDEHYKPWFKVFLNDVFNKSNQIKHDLFIKRCIKTSPYNKNSQFNFAMLNRLARLRSKERKNYERNTVSSIAKIL